MLRPTVIYKKMSGIVKSANKIENYVGILLQNPALCPGVPNQRGTQFAAPGAQFAGPDLQGPICHSIKKCGAQFAAKSARGLICLEPQHVAPYLPCLSCQVQCSGLDILFQLHVLVVHSFHFLIFPLFHILLHHCFIPQSACSQNVVRM